jgi:hypothetical protein
VRKLTSILLLFSLLVLLFGYHLAFYFQIAAVKAEMLASLKNQQNHRDIITFHFNQRLALETEWENEHEFRYNGEMYDVVEKKQKGDQLVIRCIPDKKETTLIKEYQKNNKRNHSNSFVQLVITQFILPSEYSVKLPQRSIAKSYFNHSYTLLSRPSSIFIPPPEVC